MFPLKQFKVSLVNEVILVSLCAYGLTGCGGGTSQDSSSSIQSSGKQSAETNAKVVVKDNVTSSIENEYEQEDLTESEKDRPAPTDSAKATSVMRQASVVGISDTTDASIKGAWSAPFNWPIIAIHAVLTPDGNVLSYGSDQEGNQTGQFVYDVWNYKTNQHRVLPNKTGTDIFCSAQIAIPSNGSVFLAGGDARGISSSRTNAGIKDTNIFDYKTNLLTPSGMPMSYARWYGTLTTLPNGTLFMQGGIDFDKKAVLIPEKYTPGQGWKTLTGIKTNYGANYPRSFVAPNGYLFAFSSNTNLYSLNTNNLGEAEIIGKLPYSARWDLPAVMFSPGKILTLLANGNTAVIDINSAVPTIKSTASPGTNRYWANTTVLPDGQVLLTGGGGLDNNGKANKGVNIALNALLWDAKTGKWIQGAGAKKAREYHSIALLLPDATVLVAGGGAPGPVKQLNAEIYYPPYLFNKDTTGNFAIRPVITEAEDTLLLNKPYTFTVNSNRSIQRVSIIKTGSITHSFDMDQRYMDVPFSLSGNRVTLNIKANSNTLTPGYYMIFAIDANGVPSLAKIVNIPSSSQLSASFALEDNISNFSTAKTIGMNGTANIVENTLSLNSTQNHQAGSAFYRAPVAIDHNTSFSVFFRFKIGGGTGGDGMAFVVQGNDAYALGKAAGGLGYEGMKKSISVELDTYANTNEVNNNHLAVIANGNLGEPLAQLKAPFNLRDNKWHGVWVDYNSFEKKLNIYLTEDPAARKPLTSSLSANINLPSILGDKMFLGFTGATGGRTDFHQIGYWSWAVGNSVSKGSGTGIQNHQLFTGQYLESLNKKFRMTLQNDGNLVITNMQTNQPIWHTGTTNRGTARALLQEDGNFVLYRLDNIPLWASHTNQKNVTSMGLTNEGKFVLYTAEGKIVYSSN